MAERIFIFIGKTAAFWAGAALVYLGVTNPMKTHLLWARTNVFAGLLMTIFGHRMQNNVASVVGQITVFLGGIGMFFVNYHFARSAFWSFACIVAGLAMVSISAAYLKAGLDEEPPRRLGNFIRFI